MTFTRPQQPASAVVGRVLISLGVLALGALAFRLSLRPVTSGSQPVQSFTQQDALNGASRLVLNLNSDHADLHIGSADLAGQALRGSLTLPGRVSRQASRSGDTLALTYTERSRGPWFSAPWSLNIGRQGLNLGPWAPRPPQAPEAPGASRAPLGRWDLTLPRGVPGDLRLKLGSGDARLDLAGSALQALNVSSASGDLQATLPAALKGDVTLDLLSGDLTTRFEGQAGAAGGQRFSASSRSGDLHLDLARSPFGQVQINALGGDVRATLPDRPGVQTSLNMAAGDLDLSVGAHTTSGRIRVDSLGGDLRLRLPGGLPVRVSVKNVIGDVSVPKGWRSGGGVYRSPGAQDGQPALEVSVQAFGGDLNIVEAGQ